MTPSPFRILFLSFIALLLLAPAPTLATVSNIPVKARLERPERLPAAGREFATALIIEAAQNAEITDLVVAGDGWRVTRWDGQRNFTMTARGSVSFALAATPSTGFGPLVLTAEIDGRPWRKTFDLSREAYGGLLPTDSDLLPPRRILAAGGEKLPPTPQYTLAQLTALAKEAPPSPTGLDKIDLTCTITGNLCYWHTPDAKWVPAFGAKVWAEVHDASSIIVPVYSLGMQSVDEWGRFTMEVPDNVEIRLGFVASSAAVIVQEDGFWEDNYRWYTTLDSIPTGMTHYDAGPVYPNSHAGALHICTDVTYAHNHFRDLGWDAPMVDLQWPDADGSFYTSWIEEVHLEPGDEWDDHTICHEWGHYWQDKFGHTAAIDYCNGVCDDDDDCGHCAWCPENDPVSWIEGNAQLLSRLNTDHIAQRATFTVKHEGIESVVVDQNCDWDPWNIENVVAGAVYDMADDDRGTETDHFRQDALGHDAYDQLDLDTADILHLLVDYCGVEDHEPYRFTGFFRCAAAYLDDLGNPQATRSMLWETAWNWDLDIDEQNPSVVPSLTSTFPLGTPTQIAMGGFNWQAAADDMSGVCGYAVALNPNTPLTPDHLIDTTNRQWWPSEQLDPGTYYFSVIAVDRSGKWSSTPATYGPIIIETPGPADLTPETPSGWTAPLVLRSTLAPTPVGPAVQPNYIQADNLYFNWAERNSGLGASGLYYDRIYLDGEAAFTSSGKSLNFGAGTVSLNIGPHDLGAIGRHTVWIRLDGLDAVAESDENNNIFAKQFVFTPKKLSGDETVARDGGLPEATAGHTLLPGSPPIYPNGDGFDIDLCLFPELVWAVPDDPANRLIMRLHPRDVGQTGFAEPLATAYSLADRPAAIIQNTSETLMNSFCISVCDLEGSGNTYRIHREVGQIFALPDTIATYLSQDNCLDYYWTFNSLTEPAWFTVKLANLDEVPLQMRFFNPGFTVGSLSDADDALMVAGSDTVAHNVLLPPGKMALTVVGRDPRAAGVSIYTISAYAVKPDLATTTADNWFANVVPQVGKPYSASSSAIPAPTTLVGDADSTGIYWSLRNISPDAGAPLGLQRQLRLDGALISSSVFIEPLAPGQEVKGVDTSLHNVRGGRHTLSHHLNTTRTIDEDDYTNNTHGRQWVWSPVPLANNLNHVLPVPSDPYGGLSYIDEGTVAPNCDGYQAIFSLPVRLGAIQTVYAEGGASDVDVGFYESADVQNGFTSALCRSTWSGNGGDFVLRYVNGPGTFTSQVGVVRTSGASAGDFSLRATGSTSSWVSPVGGTRTGTVENGTFLDTAILSLPVGAYRFTLASNDAPLGFSLHDLSEGYSAKTSPWQDGSAWQELDTEGQDISFVIEVIEPVPARFGLVVWRTDSSSLAQDAAWTVTISGDVSAVGDDLPEPLVEVSRLVGAAPNPFNPATSVIFDIARPGPCTLTVHDLRGRLVRTLVASELDPGRHEVAWDGLDEQKQRASSGIYLVRLATAQGEVSLLKLTLVK